MTDIAGHRPGEPAYLRLIAGLFFAGVAKFAQLYSPQAVLPFLAADLGTTPATAALAVSAATLGLAVAVIPWSMVADRIGRRPTMAIGVVAATAVGLLAPLAPTMEVFLAARFVEGAALGAVPAVALAYLNEEVDAGHAARAAGSYIAGTTVGGLAGRIIAGPLAEEGSWRVGVFVVAVVCAASAVLFLWLAPRARRFEASPARIGAVLRRLGVVLRSPAQLALAAQGFLLMGGFVAVYNYVGFVLAAPPYVVPQAIVSLLFLAYLAGTVSSPRAGALASRFGRMPVLLGSTAVMAAGALLMLVPSLPVLVAGLLVLTAGFFGAHAVASGWTPVVAPPGTAAQASSLYYLAYYAGSSVFGWALGLVFAGVGWIGVAGAVVLLCAASAGCAYGALRRAGR